MEEEEAEEEEAEEEEVRIFCIIEIIVCFSTLPPSEVFVLVLVLGLHYITLHIKGTRHQI